MYRIIVEATTKKDEEMLPDLLRHLCFGLTDESAIKLRTPGWKWDGHSGGDDAYFGLIDKVVQVRKTDPEKEKLKKLLELAAKKVLDLEQQVERYEMESAGEDW
jgi:hypothetical protein